MQSMSQANQAAQSSGKRIHFLHLVLRNVERTFAEVI
jgi:hypothetical protein